MRTFVPSRAAAALAAAMLALMAGCATRDARNAAYEKALAPWQGAAEETLLARWGPPQATELADSGRWLTYVTNNGGGTASTVGFSIGGFGFGGGRLGVGGGVGVVTPIGDASPAGAPCTTRFLVEHGRVSSWTFDGPGCGVAGG